MLLPDELVPRAEQGSEWCQELRHVFDERRDLVDESYEASEIGYVLWRRERRDGCCELWVRPVPILGYDQPRELDFLLRELKLLTIERDSLLLASLHESTNIADVLFLGSTVDYDVIEDLLVPSEVLECFVPPPVVVF